MSNSIPETAALPAQSMSLPRVRLGVLAGLVVCLVVAVVVTLPHSPANMSYALTDGGTFLYVAQRMLEGAVPYRDVWDHKPPLIYFIDALGLWLDQGTRWGVWTLEMLAVTSAAALCYRLLQRVFGVMPAILATVMWLLSFLFLAEDGNMTETFVLPLQFACLLLAYEVETKHRGVYRWRGVAIGVLLGLVFFLKLNEIGVGVAIGLYVVLRAWKHREWRKALTALATIAAGFIAVTVIMLGVMVAEGNLLQFWQIVIGFNVVYADRFSFVSSRVEALIAGYNFLTPTGLVVYGILGALIGVTALLAARERLSREPTERPLLPLLEICALALPIEIVLVTTTGRPFDHYFLALYYVLAVWAAFLFYFLQRAVLAWLAPVSARTQVAFTACFGLVIGLTLLPAVWQDVMVAQTLNQLKPPAVVDYIREHTKPSDPVLILGHEARILFFADRRSPTRLVYQSVFENTPYVTEALAEEFYTDVLNHPPALIVDVKGQGLANVTGVNSLFVQRRVGKLNQLYQRAADVAGWTVYAPVPAKGK